MLHWIAATQLVFVAGALAAAGVFKLWARGAPVAARRSALARVLGKERAVAAFKLIGMAELAIAAALLLAPLVPAGPYAAVLATGWSTGMLGYLGYAKVSAPGSSCGCLSAKEAPITWRAFARAGLLVAASAAAVFSTPEITAPLAMAALLLAEAALFVALSAELDHRWLLPLRRFRARLRHPLRETVSTEVPLQATLQQLYRSTAYRSAHDLISSAVLDHWDEREWRMVTFATRQGEQRAIVVFAVPRLTDDPDQVRAALVPDPDPHGADAVPVG
ncbi:MauE/DoxX family redox-associated membrane protein [Amycolatopsis nigrescens]|uniref:MauE/DoxX family redox-associated membrane protein n=1 Tax=Amycolatopsis nigrescens TaxID=381445 RepID=UPI00036C7878|nr:MauE/DoxX family redox-associated membrane protein [Amycolatopsis nigrescens]